MLAENEWGLVRSPVEEIIEVYFWEVSKMNPEDRHVIEKAIFVPCLLVEGYVSKS